GDIGGPVPGSCSATAREIYNEGLHLPAVRLEAAGQPQDDISRIVAANSRTPDVVLGDIRGQLGSARLGERRLAELVRREGGHTLPAYVDQLFDVTEQRVRRAVNTWSDGQAEAERFVDDDGVDLGKPLRVHAAVRKQGDQITFDFAATADQARGPANIRPPLLEAACAYVLIALIDPGMAINAGLFSAFDVRTRPGSLVDPHFPAPVNTYNPTVHAVIDALFDAMSRMVSGRGRADGPASRSFIVGGAGRRSGTSYVQYELFGGGAGATESHDGVSATTMNQSNGRIASIEIIESEFPTRVRRFELVPDSGGPGRHRGGLAFRREYENLRSAHFALRSTRHAMPPRGAGGGQPGGTGRLLLHPDDDEPHELAARTARHELQPGDVFQLRTPGGGGFGEPFDRDPESVRRDVEEGYVTVERAAADYGVALAAVGWSWQVDDEATARLRGRDRP
ncbi:MAG: hydantoinase B/oxoprolinase family protein, partial [Egibacteraceae bacterium]